MTALARTPVPPEAYPAGVLSAQLRRPFSRPSPAIRRRLGERVKLSEAVLPSSPSGPPFAESIGLSRNKRGQTGFCARLQDAGGRASYSVNRVAIVSLMWLTASRMWISRLLRPIGRAVLVCWLGGVGVLESPPEAALRCGVEACLPCAEYAVQHLRRKTGRASMRLTILLSVLFIAASSLPAAAQAPLKLGLLLDMGGPMRTSAARELSRLCAWRSTTSEARCWGAR
jgi:hypothetical protein